MLDMLFYWEMKLIFMWDIYINQSKNQKEIKYVRHIYLFCLCDKWNKCYIQELYKLIYAFYMWYKINILIVDQRK